MAVDYYKIDWETGTSEPANDFIDELHRRIAAAREEADALRKLMKRGWWYEPVPQPIEASMDPEHPGRIVPHFKRYRCEVVRTLEEA